MHDRITSVELKRKGEVGIANIKSAAKRVEIARIRTIRNSATKSQIKTAARRFNETMNSGDEAIIKENLIKAIKTIDKAVAKGTLHKNTAARKKSQLQRNFNRNAG